MHAEPLRKREERLNPDVTLAALDPTDVVRVQAGEVGQRLLAKSALLAETPHFAPERQQFWIDFHARTVAPRS